MTYADYLEAVGLTQAGLPNWRSGQTHFNVLCDMRPDLSERVRATELDPFHLDSRLPQFLAFLEAEWNT